LSYRPGDRLRLHAMSSGRPNPLVITRDGLAPETVLETTIATRFAPTPADCSVTRLRLAGGASDDPDPEDWPIRGLCRHPDHSRPPVAATMFVLRAAKPRRESP
jgi:hypothetical protein